MAQPSNLYTQYFLICDVKCWLFLFQRLHHLASKVTDTMDWRINLWLCNAHAFCNHKAWEIIIPTRCNAQICYETHQSTHSMYHLYKKIVVLLWQMLWLLSGDLLPSCLMLRSLWNSGVSMILTNSGWSTKCPWMGSWNNCVETIKFIWWINVQ